MITALFAALSIVRSMEPAAVARHSAAATVSAQTVGFTSPVSTSGTVPDKMTEYVNSTEILASSKTKRFLQAARINTLKTASRIALNEAGATVAKTLIGQYVLHVPFVASENRLEISGYTAFLDSNLRVTSTGEVVFTVISSDSGRMQLWQNGALALDKTASNGSGAASNTAPTTATPAFSWSKLNKCLLGAGVSQWALTLIGFGCALLCGATLGTGCIACVIGFAAIAGGTVGTCVGRAMA